ncbi:MAG: M3 family metallopeptidase [Terriglobales bacterium]
MKRASLLLFLFLALLPAAAEEMPPLATQLDAKEQELEQLWAEYWRTDREIALGNDKLSTLPIQKKIRALMTEPGFLEKLRVARFDDRVLERRRYFFLQEATETLITADPKLARLVEGMERDEANIRYRVGKKRLTRAQLNNLVGHEPDRKLRQQAWEARAQITAKTGERIRRAMKLRKALAARHAGREFDDFMLERKQVDRKRLLAWFEEIRSQTDAAYQELIERMRRELKVERVEPWDLEYYFSTLSSDFEAKLSDREAVWPKAKQIAAAMGMNLDSLPVDLVIADITFGGGTYPILYGKEVSILVNKYAGIRFTDTLLHEAGHALHYSLMNEPSFLLRANYPEPYGEGLGQVISLLLYREEIATRYFGLTTEEVRAIQERYRLKSLFDLRETMADSLFEFAAYENPDQDLAALYNRFYSQYLGVEMHGTKTWAFDPFYSSGPIYLQSYVLAEMVGRQIHAAVDQRFGKNWGPEAGAYLREKFFTRGGSATMDEILEKGTGEPLSARALIAALKATNTQN